MVLDPYAAGIRCKVSANSPQDGDALEGELRQIHRNVVRVDETHFKLTVSDVTVVQKLVEGRGKVEIANAPAPTA
jgi:hypothetical protein